MELGSFILQFEAIFISQVTYALLTAWSDLLLLRNSFSVLIVHFVLTQGALI